MICIVCNFYILSSKFSLCIFMYLDTFAANKQKSQNTLFLHNSFASKIAVADFFDNYQVCFKGLFKEKRTAVF